MIGDASGFLDMYTWFSGQSKAMFQRPHVQGHRKILTLYSPKYPKNKADEKCRLGTKPWKINSDISDREIKVYDLISSY